MSSLTARASAASPSFSFGGDRVARYPFAQGRGSSRVYLDSGGALHRGQEGPKGVPGPGHLLGNPGWGEEGALGHGRQACFGLSSSDSDAPPHAASPGPAYYNTVGATAATTPMRTSKGSLGAKGRRAWRKAGDPFDRSARFPPTEGEAALLRGPGKYLGISPSTNRNKVSFGQQSSFSKRGTFSTQTRPHQFTGRVKIQREAENIIVAGKDAAAASRTPGGASSAASVAAARLRKRLRLPPRSNDPTSMQAMLQQMKRCALRTSAENDGDDGGDDAGGSGWADALLGDGLGLVSHNVAGPASGVEDGEGGGGGGG